MIPIVAGLLMGAAMGGGIAALQKKNILEGALMGAAGGALGGVLMPGAGAAGAIAPAAEGAGIAGASILNPAVGASGMGAGAASARLRASERLSRGRSSQVRARTYQVRNPQSLFQILS